MTNPRKKQRVTLQIACECATGRRWEIMAERADELPAVAVCASCGASRRLHLASITTEGGLLGCAACGHPELYSRRSMSRRVGLSIVVVAACLAPVTHYVSLGVAALLDLVLFRVMTGVAECYVCKAVHRGFAAEPRHPRFDHQIAERLRFGPRAVMGKPMRSSGTAGAPDPEH